MNTGSHRAKGSGRRHYFHHELIPAEQVRQLHELAPVGFLATAINAVIVFFVLRQTECAILIPWLAAILAITALRGGLVVWYRKSRPEPAAAPVWRKRFVLALAGTGIAWGSIGLFPFTYLSLTHQVFIAFVLGGMTAGAASTYAPVKVAYASFAIPALLPLTLHFFLLNDPFHVAMGAMLSLFGLILWRIALYNHRVNRRSLLLRYRNRGMIEVLKRAKEEMEDLNARLRGEIEAKRRAEAELLAHREELERIVAERTADLHESREELKTAKEAAEAASLAKSEFLANMSHEMRTPLAGALGMITLVLDMEIPDDVRGLLEMADRSATSLLRLIADLLDFSRIEAGMATFEQKVFSLSRVLQTAVETVGVTAADKGLDLSAHVDPAVPAEVRGDEGRLRQVLVNLVGNAVKFTERGVVEISVRPCGDAGESEGCLLFAVRDTGIGIPHRHQEQIFGKFTQADPSISRKYGGTGLGLALTKEIVEKMGGRIWVESREGEGSTFLFTFTSHEASGSRA